jgi:hypothetical protein
LAVAAPQRRPAAEARGARGGAMMCWRALEKLLKRDGCCCCCCCCCCWAAIVVVVAAAVVAVLALPPAAVVEEEDIANARRTDGEGWKSALLRSLQDRPRRPLDAREAAEEAAA